MDIKAGVFSAVLFLLFVVLLLYMFHRWSKRITEHRVHIILNNRQNPGLVSNPPSVPCGQLDPSYVAFTSIKCTVCLSEIQLGERIRLLPNCNHCFHIDCIDMWFSSHATCPICRSHVDKLNLGSSAMWSMTLLRKIMSRDSAESAQQPNLA